MFNSWGFRLTSVHQAENPALAAQTAQVINMALTDKIIYFIFSGYFHWRGQHLPTVEQSVRKQAG